MTKNKLASTAGYLSGNLQFDTHLGSLTNSAGETLRLSPILLKLLLCFLSSDGRVVTRGELFDQVWPNQSINDDVLTRAISDLRAQLFKLDESAKYIETIPRRGYRWLLPFVLKQSCEDINTSVVDALTWAHPEALATPRGAIGIRTFKSLFGYALVSLLLAAGLMLLVAQFAMKDRFSVAVLPTQTDYPSGQSSARQFDELLALVLRNQRINLLSKAAVASRPTNPFPYFYKEFNASFVLEARLNTSEGINHVDLSLVDARSGIELRSLIIEAANNTELAAKLAKGLEANFFVDDMAY